VKKREEEEEEEEEQGDQRGRHSFNNIIICWGRRKEDMPIWDIEGL
jgi:hypothetical protein